MSSHWDDPAEMLTRAQVARGQGDRDLAYQLYARASELSPQDPTAWQGRAETATSTDEALVSYAYASALNTENKPLGRTLDAVLAQRIQDATRNDAPLLVALGQELAEVGLTERARALLERAAELDTSSTDALVWLAGVAPDDQAQLDYLNRALETNPRDPRARAGVLSAQLPPSPSSPVSVGERFSGLSAAPAADRPTESATIERLRKLRETVPPADSKRVPAPSPRDEFQKLAPGTDTRLRNFLVILLVLVALLAVIGSVLMQLR